MDPSKLLYATTHEWLHLDRSQSPPIATVGITDFAVKQLNDLVYMELPKLGSKVAAGAAFGEVESVKAVSSLYAPVAGEVIEVNGDLPKALDKLVDDPFGAGWVAKLRVSDDSGLKELMSQSAYLEQCARDSH
jgi:glycine cleavage system H protein